MAAGKTLDELAAEAGEPKIASALDEFRVPTHSLEFHPKNARRGDVTAIAQSLTRFGQVRPIIADRDGMVLAGNHVLAAAEKLGWDEVAAVRIDELSDREAEAYLVADNRLAELGTYDGDALERLLTSLSGSEGGLHGTGYPTDDDGLQRLLARLNPSSPSEFPSPDDGAEAAEYKCPGCGYEWDGQPRP